MIEDMMLNFNKDLAFEVWLLAKPIKDDWLSGKTIDVIQGTYLTRDRRRCWEKRKPMWIRYFHRASTSKWFEKVIIFIILLNTIILTIHWAAMNSELEKALSVLNYCFTILFALELVIKIIGLGPERWWFDKFNLFDAVIVIASLIELCLTNAQTCSSLAFRALRLLTLLRSVHRIPGLRSLVNSILNSFEPFVYLVSIVILFVFIFGVLGVQLFAGLIYPDSRSTGFEIMTKPWRFDTLWYSMITFLHLFTNDGWPSIVEDTRPATVIILAVIIGLCIFKNMFLAIILINKKNNEDNIHLMIDDLL
eukprot:406749_1